ncbi:hypothetical protein ONE63_007820 [Megalurothrips usitatus]|uniref:SCP domain-containing protein n=1 Tax=Megalurothrips usitatus TaxID=439358 RepID=A0AAV7XNV8_9NEOP|nr:hypothetical protein ONE63_007820 [Megalurothrips usitatus]
MMTMPMTAGRRAALWACVAFSVVAVVACCSAPGKRLLGRGVSCQDKQIILDTHNRLRQSVALGRVAGQPGAANMMEMTWDDELAAVAQRWADSCLPGHDHSRHVSRFYVGQNIATSWTYPRPNALGATPEFAKQITNWFNEVRGYSFRSTSSATGHYSQLIWGESHLVGCGYAYYHDQSRGFTKVYVCNYGPGGNVAGYAPYQVGTPACPLYGTQPSSSYPGLCSTHGYFSGRVACYG